MSAKRCIFASSPATDFFSANCLKEVDAALEGTKPLILVHESDVAKGGAPLEKLRADCDCKGRIAVFDNGDDAIQWHRVNDFQLLTYLRLDSNRVRLRMLTGPFACACVRFDRRLNPCCGQAQDDRGANAAAHASVRVRAGAAEALHPGRD